MVRSVAPAFDVNHGSRIAKYERRCCSILYMCGAGEMPKYSLWDNVMQRVSNNAVAMV